MATYSRRNAWNGGGTFAGNPDLVWYAVGVRTMMSRALNNPNSWWFFAAIHGEYLNGTSYPGWAYIPGPPAVPTTPLPSQTVQDEYWNQCQHQSWFFPPWHRGYLVALEAQLREDIVAAGGPDDWALPYWDYLGSGSQYEIPPAFTAATMPDGTANPLFVTARYGPLGNGQIFIQIPPINNDCMSNTIYTGSNAATPRPGFGGPLTGFWHGGGHSGNLEQNPHNLVHVQVGGNAPGGGVGLMGDPDTAALDPIFYLHHCNIDRMWAGWNDAGNPNPTAPDWLNGPTGARKFIMPMPGATPWVFHPVDVDSLSKLNYVYDKLPPIPAGRGGPNRLRLRLGVLGAAPNLAPAHALAMENPPNSEIIGTHDGGLPIKSSGALTTIQLAPAAGERLFANLAAAAESPPDRTYLELENVRGKSDAHQLNISVAGRPVGAIGLFGLRRASDPDGPHGGSGLNFELEITDIVDALFATDGLDPTALEVRIQPSNALPDDAGITVGRVSVHRESFA